MVSETAAQTVRTEEDRDSMRAHVFKTFEPKAREQLGQEVLIRIKAMDVTVEQLFDHLCGKRMSNDFMLALEADDSLEVVRLLKAAREEVVAQLRQGWIEEMVEDRVWDLYNRSPN